MNNFILSIFLIAVIGCSSKENNYNKMLDWMHGIPKGTTIETVKKSQPDFVIVDWKNRDTFPNSYRFDVKPKDYYDILQMSNWLSFDSNGEYIGRGYMK